MFSPISSDKGLTYLFRVTNAEISLCPFIMLMNSPTWVLLNGLPLDASRIFLENSSPLVLWNSFLILLPNPTIGKGLAFNVPKVNVNILRPENSSLMFYGQFSYKWLIPNVFLFAHISSKSLTCLFSYPPSSSEPIVPHTTASNVSMLFLTNETISSTERK